MLAFLLIFLAVLAWQMEFIKDVFGSSSELSFDPGSLKNKLYLLLGAIVVIGIIFMLFKRLGLLKKIESKIKKIKNDIVQGILTVLHVKQKGIYILITFIIFLLWTLMLYAVFLAYAPTGDLPYKAALIITIVGTLAFLLPIQAGIGVWHLIAIQCLFLFGIDKDLGGRFALIAHTFTNVIMFLVFSPLGFVLLPIVNNRKKDTNDEISG
jgi:hypothetical protein